MSVQTMIRSNDDARSVRAVSESGATTITTEVVHELAPAFSQWLGETVVTDYVHTAVTDLRDSVSPESLPEMAARLATHRIVARLTA